MLAYIAPWILYGNPKTSGFKMIHDYPSVIKHVFFRNPPFIDDFPIKTFIYRGFSIATFDFQMVGFG